MYLNFANLKKGFNMSYLSLYLSSIAMEVYNWAFLYQLHGSLDGFSIPSPSLAVMLLVKYLLVSSKKNVPILCVFCATACICVWKEKKIVDL